MSKDLVTTLLRLGVPDAEVKRLLQGYKRMLGRTGWRERKLHPSADVRAQLVADLESIPMNEAHFAMSKDPYGEIADQLLEKGWRR